MKCAAGSIAFLLVLRIPLVSAESSLQQRGQRASARQDETSIVEVVGCLTNGPNNTWLLTSATEPVVSRVASTTAEAVKAAETKPLGKWRYTLIGLTIFNPASHNGHRMAVKGLLIKDSKEERINVTSFQMVTANCTK